MLDERYWLMSKTALLRFDAQDAKQKPLALCICSKIEFLCFENLLSVSGQVVCTLYFVLMILDMRLYMGT